MADKLWQLHWATWQSLYERGSYRGTKRVVVEALLTISTVTLILLGR